MGSPWSGTSISSPYGPATPNTGTLDTSGFPQDLPPTSSNAMHTPAQQPMPLPPNFANPAIPDVSAMMFPSGGDEPFLYPNQPLTTFENNQQSAAKQNNPYLSNLSNGAGLGLDNNNTNTNNGTPHPQPQQHLYPSTSPSSRQGRPADDNMEAQFFALPPYLEQSRGGPQRPAPTSFPADGMGFGSGVGGGGGGGMPMTPTPNGALGSMPNGWPQQQQAFHPGAGAGGQQQQGGGGGGGNFSNINISDLFGGAEWNAMIMDPGFRQ